MSEKKITLLKLTDCGLYSPQGDFYIDPWKAVNKAIITHAHSDHARWGSKNYLAHKDSEGILRLRLGNDISFQGLNYNEPIFINGVKVSLHPAGHVLGSAQIRLEYEGEVTVVSGDYKTEPDVTCVNFEPVKCNTFITESTFGLPIYKWRPSSELFNEINLWWSENNKNGVTSIIYGYALGKAQRILAGLDTSIGKIFTHGAVENINQVYRNYNISLPETTYLGSEIIRSDIKGSMVLAPPSADVPGWLKKFGETSRAFASGWMLVRGARRRRAFDRGFVISDHTDWPNLLSVIKQTEAENIWVTHGFSEVVVKYLCEQGYKAKVVPTRFEGENPDAEI